MSAARRSACLLALLLVACEPNIRLVVDVRTDFVPGLEFDQVEVRLDDGRFEATDVTSAQDYAAARHVAEWDRVAQGDRKVEVRLLRRSVLVVSQRAIVPLTQSRLVTFRIPRDCRAVECGSPDLACIAGRCSPIECTVESACEPLNSTCESECDEGRPCTPSTTACARAVCACGVCLELPSEESQCADGQRCVPGVGCTAPEGFCENDGECSDGFACTLEHCVDSHCTQTSSDEICIVGHSERCEPGHANADPATGCVGYPCDPYFADALAAGTTGVCALLDGDVWCWGDFSRAAVAIDALDGKRPVLDQAGDFVRIAAGGGAWCAIDSAGVLNCGGTNFAGEIGLPSTTTYMRPMAIDSDHLYLDIMMDDDGTYALREDRTLVAFGENRRLRFGIGNVEGIIARTEVSANARAAVVGFDHGCFASNIDGSVLCAGNSGDGAVTGRVGEESVMDGVPFALESLTGVERLAAGQGFTCVLQRRTEANGDALVCWGTNTNHEASEADRHPVTPNQRAGGEIWTDVAAGAHHGCAITTSQSLFCWGSNDSGQLGVGDRTDRAVATQVPGQFTEVVCGPDFTCALDLNRQVWCWGRNDHYQLGIGHLENRLVPTPLCTITPE